MRIAALPAVTFEGQTGTLLYDLQTFVLDEFDMPAIRFAFIRAAHYSSPSK
jgi:hypothetical protein